MTAQIIVNHAVKDLKRSIAFFTELGFRFDPRFTNEQGACLVIGEGHNVMLLTEDFFSTFTKKQICDPKKQTEAILALSVESKAQVEDLVKKAMTAGAAKSGEVQDSGFMYQHGFEDPDGHLWEVFYMDESAFPKQ